MNPDSLLSYVFVHLATHTEMKNTRYANEFHVYRLIVSNTRFIDMQGSKLRWKIIHRKLIQKFTRSSARDGDGNEDVTSSSTTSPTNKNLKLTNSREKYEEIILN